MPKGNEFLSVEFACLGEAEKKIIKAAVFRNEKPEWLAPAMILV
ncbi:hypothetical protein [Spirosoma endophyticum]|nr:hypothetical protein [Spirosoma endophyticum]